MRKPCASGESHISEFFGATLVRAGGIVSRETIVHLLYTLTARKQEKNRRNRNSCACYGRKFVLPKSLELFGNRGMAGSKTADSERVPVFPC